MTNPETYVVENIIYDWNKYKKSYYKKFFHEMSMFWKSREPHKRSAVIGLVALFFCPLIFFLYTVFLLLHAIVQYLITSLLNFEALNSILSNIETTLFASGRLYLISSVVCLLIYIWFERDNVIRKPDYYRYWSPIFLAFLDNRFENKILLNYVTDHINFLESEQSRLNQLVQSVVISILLNIILTKLMFKLELFAIEPLHIVLIIVVIIVVIMVVIFLFSFIQRTLFLICGISYTKLLRAREVKMLLQLEILRTESQSDSKTAIG